MTLGFACGADSYTSRDRETYTETTTATAGDVHDTATESVCICRHTGPNLSSPPLVLVAVVLLSSPMAEGGSLFSLRGASVNVACIFVGLTTDIVGGKFTVDADEKRQRCFWLWS